METKVISEADFKLTDLFKLIPDTPTPDLGLIIDGISRTSRFSPKIPFISVAKTESERLRALAENLEKRSRNGH